jgi:hypothetical protein
VNPDHRDPVMRVHLSAAHHGRMDPATAMYTIRISGHLGAMMLSAFPAMVPQWHGAETVLTGLLDRSALYGVLAEIDALGLDLLEVRLLEPERESPEPDGGHL